jgi:formamidopyrimidine-DNA glycosylase
VPELPEVETLRRDLEPVLVGRVIASAVLGRTDVLRAPASLARNTAEALLLGRRVAAVARHGKALAIISSDGPCLQVHLGMSGQLLHGPAAKAALNAPHAHAQWTLSDGTRLVFRDPRRFGSLHWLADRAALAAHWARLGPDALGISSDRLAKALGSTRRPIKTALLDQARLAGVGNIYADEALHAARLHPTEPARDLDPVAYRRLALALDHVLQRSLQAGGTTQRDYRRPDGSFGRNQENHLVYGRSTCGTCHSATSSILLAGRTSRFCAKCQPAGVG